MNYAYCRASTIVQETSCAVQADMLRQRAERDGEKLDHVFTDEDTSGRVFPFLERQAAQQLMKVVQPGDHVHIHKIDRLGRSTIDVLSTITMLMNRGVHLHVLDFGGQIMNLEGATGFAMVAMQAVFAELAGGLIRERTKEALKYRRDRGMPVNGFSPYCMRRKKRRTAAGNHEPYDVWDESECQDIREIYRRVHDNHEALYRVAIDFAKQGRLTANGKPWARAPKREGRPWRDDRVRRTYYWYTCLRELGLDVESTPIAVVTMFSTAWRAAKCPKSLGQWRTGDAAGLKKFVERVKKEAGA